MRRGVEEDQDRQESFWMSTFLSLSVQSLSSGLNCIYYNVVHNLLAALSIISAAHRNAPAWPLWLLPSSDRVTVRE